MKYQLKMLKETFCFFPRNTSSFTCGKLFLNGYRHMYDWSALTTCVYENF